MKSEMRIEINKLENINKRVNNDLKRVNSYVKYNSKFMKILLEDQMILHMI